MKARIITSLMALAALLPVSCSKETGSQQRVLQLTWDHGSYAQSPYPGSSHSNSCGVHLTHVETRNVTNAKAKRSARNSWKSRLHALCTSCGRKKGETAWSILEVSLAGQALPRPPSPLEEEAPLAQAPLCARDTPHPMCSTPSWFSASCVHTAILSPLARMLMTAPHTSRLCSPKLSPMRHNSWTRKGGG